MDTIEQKVYRVSWPINEWHSTRETKVYYSFKEAKKRAEQPKGWWGSQGSVSTQILVIDKQTKRVLYINEPKAI